MTATTATFQTEPLTPEEWAADALAGEPGRHGAWAVEDGRSAAAAGAAGAAGAASAAGADSGAGAAGGGDSGGDRAPAGGGGAGGGGLAGYLLVQQFKSRCAYRDTAEVTVYLAPDRLGRGLGAAALAYAEEHARTVGLHALLAVVCAENDASLRAFERAGYERCALLREVGTKFGRRLDVVYLERLVPVD